MWSPEQNSVGRSRVRSPGQQDAKKKRRKHQESSGQLSVGEGTEQPRDGGEGEGDHVSNDQVTLTLMRAAAAQTLERDVADVDQEV